MEKNMEEKKDSSYYNHIEIRYSSISQNPQLQTELSTEPCFKRKGLIAGCEGFADLATGNRPQHPTGLLQQGPSKPPAAPTDSSVSPNILLSPERLEADTKHHIIPP